MTMRSLFLRWVLVSRRNRVCVGMVLWMALVWSVLGTQQHGFASSFAVGSNIMGTVHRMNSIIVHIV